jgi:hypothetical protein
MIGAFSCFPTSQKECNRRLRVTMTEGPHKSFLQSHPTGASTVLCDGSFVEASSCHNNLLTQGTMLSLFKRPLSPALSRRIISSSTSAARAMSSLPSWATVDPTSLGASSADAAYLVPNLVDGQWKTQSKNITDIIHPLDKNKPPIFKICDTQFDEIQPLIDSLRKVSKSGLHNPIKDPHRYVQYGEISRLVSARIYSYDCCNMMRY